MALDDFDDEDELEELEEGSPEAVAELDSFGEGGGSDLDDDLFDFPDPSDAAAFDYSCHGAGVFASGAAGATSRSQEPDAPLPEPSSSANQESAGRLLSSSDAPSGVPSGSHAANHDLSPMSPRSPYFDATVDEDLYDFPDVFAGGHVTEDVAPAIDLPPARPLDPLGLGLDKGKAREGESAPAPPADPGPPTAAADEPVAAPHAEPTFAATGPLTVAPPTTYSAAIPTTARGRLLEVLAVAFLVLNTGLVLFAWQANSSFHDTLETVTRTVSETLAAGRSSGEPAIVRMPVPDAGTTTVNEAPSALPDYSIESLEAARELLTAGRYMDARRRLYRLLANADAAGIEPRVTTEAEFLIAESYELQGRALAEEGR